MSDDKLGSSPVKDDEAFNNCDRFPFEIKLSRKLLFDLPNRRWHSVYHCISSYTLCKADFVTKFRLTDVYSPQQRSRDVYDPDRLTMRQAERVDQHRDQCTAVNHESSFSEKPTFMYTYNYCRQPIKRCIWKSRTLEGFNSFTPRLETTSGVSNYIKREPGEQKALLKFTKAQGRPSILK